MTPEIGAFVEQARRYCEFIEREAGALELPARLAEARLRVVELYRAALALPAVEPPDGFDAEPAGAPPSSWAGFGRLDSYWMVFDPHDERSVVAGSLSSDLIEIYDDVRGGLALWDSAAPREAAIWEWRFGVDSHWGRHALEALRVLHACVEIEPDL